MPDFLLFLSGAIYTIPLVGILLLGVGIYGMRAQWTVSWANCYLFAVVIIPIFMGIRYSVWNYHAALSQLGKEEGERMTASDWTYYGFMFCMPVYLAIVISLGLAIFAGVWIRQMLITKRKGAASAS